MQITLTVKTDSQTILQALEEVLHANKWAIVAGAAKNPIDEGQIAYLAGWMMSQINSKLQVELETP